MKRYCCLLAVLLLVFTGCSGPNNERSRTEIGEAGALGPRSGDVLPERPERVVALSSSIAEIWLLAGGELSGVTEDALDGRLNLPADTPVVGTVKDPGAENILALRPELVLLSQDIASHTAIRELLEKAGVSCYTAKVETREDYLATLRDFTDLTGNEGCYQRNGIKIMEEVDTLLANVPEAEDDIPPPTALFLRAYSSGVKVKARDHTVCTILEEIGVENIAAREGFPLEELSLETILQANPDYIFLVLMGDEEAAAENVQLSLEQNPAWRQLTAVKEGRVVILPKDLYHNKPNSRWGEAYEGLLEIVYPDWYPMR